MQWEGKIGPSFIVVLALAILSGVSWLTDGRAAALIASAALSERVDIIETQLKVVTGTVARIENKLDVAPKNGR